MREDESQGAARAAGLTVKGEARARNEDALAVLPDDSLYIVSDGLGGHPAGDTASKIVVRVLPTLLKPGHEADQPGEATSLETGLRNAILDLGRRLREQSADKTGLEGMGATVVAALVGDRTAVIGHMGDSRAYLYRRGRLRRLTEDHTVVSILLRQGRISGKEAGDHLARGRLSRFVGMEGDVRPDVRTVQIGPGDRLLLCTDGLTGTVPEGSIASILGRPQTPELACRTLVDAALKANAEDNVTALVVDR